MTFDHITSSMVGSASLFTPAMMTETSVEAIQPSRWLFSEEHSQKGPPYTSANEDRCHGVFGDDGKRRWQGLSNKAGVGVSDGH